LCLCANDLVVEVAPEELTGPPADVALRRGGRQADVMAAAVEGRAARRAAVDERRRLDELGGDAPAHHAGGERERLRADAGVAADVDRVAEVQRERGLLRL